MAGPGAMSRVFLETHGLGTCRRSLGACFFSLRFPLRSAAPATLQRLGICSGCFSTPLTVASHADFLAHLYA